MTLFTRLLTALCLFLLIGTSAAEREDGFPPAPEFPAGLQWFNVDHPLRLEDLRGKVVILDFWTYGCINCIHVMDELARLRKRFGDGLAVIGVHSPKFDNEGNSETLKRILIRYQRDEPVVNDPEYRMMRLYAVRAWPTLVVIDPKGGYVGDVAGEGHEDRLARAIERLFEIHVGHIDDTPIELKLGALPTANRWFGAPEKIAVGRDRLAISDSLRHRILVPQRPGNCCTRSGETGPISPTAAWLKPASARPAVWSSIQTVSSTWPIREITPFVGSTCTKAG